MADDDLIRAEAYGPSLGEYSYDQTHGPLGQLQQGQYAVSPDLSTGHSLGETFQFTDASGNIRTGIYADHSYKSPGQPNSKTIEAWNGRDIGYVSNITWPSAGVRGVVKPESPTFGPESGSESATPPGTAKNDILSKDFMQDQIRSNFPEYNKQDSEQVWQAFDKKNDTPLKKIKALYPEYADTEPHLLAETLRQKYYPDVTSDEFWERLNPPTGMFAGVQAELDNFGKGFMAQGSATLHASSAKAYESIGGYQEFGKWIADQIGATPYIQGIQQFLGHPEGYFRQAVKYLDEQGKKQEAAAAQSQTQAEQVKGIGGEIGRAGGAITGEIPEMMSTAAIPGGSLATRIALASGYEALSGFGQKIQQGQEQAFLEAGKDGFMGATNALIINSPLGRLKSGLTFTLLNTGQNELENWINGKPSSVQDDTLHATIDFGLGVVLGKAREKAPQARPAEAPEKPPSILALPYGRRGITATDILGPERTPVEMPGEQGFVFGSRGGLQIRPGVERQIEEPVQPGEAPSLVFENHDALMEELDHAIEARDQGDYKTAAEHIDRSMAMMSPEDQADVTQRVIDHINPKPEVKKPLSDEAVKTFVDHFYGLGNRGEMGSIINPFHRRKGEEPKLAHERAPEDYLQNAIIARQGGFDIAQPDKLKNEFVVMLNGEEMQRFGSREEASKAIQTFRSKYPSQSGAMINPAQILQDFFREHLPKREKREGYSKWDEEFHGERVNPVAAAIVKHHTSEAQFAKVAMPANLAMQSGLGSRIDIRSRIEKSLHIDEQLRGATKVSRRKAAFNRKTRAELKQILLNHDDKVSSGDRELDEILKFHDQVYAAVEAAEKGARFKYEPRDSYMFQAIKKKGEIEEKRWEGWLNKSSASSPDPRFTHQRQLPKWRDVFAAGFEPESYNPEDLLQMRLGQHANAIRKIMSMDDMVREELAIPAKAASKDIQEAWRDPKSIDGTTRLPNGEKYYVEPSARKVLEIAWDQFNLAYQPVVGPWYRALMIGKGMSAGLKLGASAAHLKHIVLSMAPASQLVRIEKLILSKDRWNGKAWQDAMSKFFNFGFTHVPEVDFWQGKRPFSESTLEQRRNILHIQQMGLDLHASQERQMQFSENLHQWFPALSTRFSKFEKPLKIADIALEFGYRVASVEPIMKYQFGTVIPRLKFIGAMEARDSLLHDHPELLKPENRMKLQVALSEVGREIESRFGEMNYANLLWKNVYKQIGTSTMLSMGWNLGALRIYAGGVKDLTSNAAHMHELVAKLKGKNVDHTFLTERLLFMINYNALTMIAASMLQYLFTKTFPNGIDFIYPRVGKDEHGKDKRVSPIEFTRELTSIWHHLADEGGGGLMGIARNKMQPFLSTVIQDIENKNFYGVKISDQDPIQQLMHGDILGSSKSFLDRFAYLLEAITPITWSQQGMGRTMDAQDRILAVFGYPPAPPWTSRTDIENAIMARKREEQPYEMTKQDVTRMDAMTRYKDALRSKDSKAIAAARDEALKAGASEKGLEYGEKHMDETPGQADLGRLKPESQLEIWNRMTDEQKRMYYKYLKPSVRQEVDKMRRYSEKN